MFPDPAGWRFDWCTVRLTVPAHKAGATAGEAQRLRVTYG